MTKYLLPLSLILLFSCNEKHGKMIAPVAAKWKAGDTFEMTIRKKSFQLLDTSGYVAFDSSQWVGKIGSNTYQDSSLFKLIIGEPGEMTKINWGNPHKRKKKKNQYWAAIETVNMKDSGWTIGDGSGNVNNPNFHADNLSISGTAIGSPPMYMVQSSGEGINTSPYDNHLLPLTIAYKDTFYAIRDSSGKWWIGDPSKALEAMYKTLNIVNKPKQ